MSHRRFLYTMGGVPLPEPIEVSEDFQALPERNATGIMVDRFMEGDRAQDGTDIGSRAKRRAYMQANGLADTSDFNEHWRKAQEAMRPEVRAAAAKGERTEALRRAYYTLKRGT